MLTPRAKQGLVLFGQHGLIIGVSSTIIALGVIFGSVKLWGQTLIVTPVLQKEVTGQVDKAKEECQAALSKHIEEANENRRDVKKQIEKQDDVNQRILDKLMTIAEDVAEMKGRMPR